MNRRSIGLGFLLAAALGGTVYAQKPVTLDEAVISGTAEIEARLNQGYKVVVLNFSSPSERFSDYVLDELMTALVRGGKLTVVDRANLELIRQETDFQMSGEVSDSSAQTIGQKLEAQSIVSGSIDDMGSYYRVRFRTIEVVSAAIQALSSHNVTKDNQIARLMGQNTVIADLGRSAGRAASNFGAGVLNIAFGLGSYFQGDVGGGLLITTGYAVSLGLIIWEVAGLKYEDSLAGIPGTVGLVTAGVTLAGGFVRPFVYNRSPRAALLLDRLEIRPTAEDGRINGLGILYTQRF